MIVIAVAVAGALGAVARFVVDAEVARRWNRSFPLGTFMINVSGSFLLGALAAMVMFHGQADEWRTILGTGFCGGYTTFSTASVDTVRLIQRGRYFIAALNAFGSAAASVIACALGLAAVWAL